MTEQTIAALLFTGAAAMVLTVGLLALRGLQRDQAPSARLAELLATNHIGRKMVYRRRGLATRWAPRAITVRLARADLDVRPRPLLLLLAVIVAVPVPGYVLAGPWWGGGVAVAEFLLIAVVVDRVAARAMAGLFGALPNFLDNVRQLVSVGNSLQQAFEKAAEAAPLTLRRHMRVPLHQLRHGVPLAECLETLAERLDLVELHMLASAVQANLRFGGRLSEVLGNLARVFRDRQRVERELLAATAETRFSALILFALPVLVAGFLMLTNAGYLRWFIDHSSGQTLLGVCAGLQVIGVVVARSIVRVEY